MVGDWAGARPPIPAEALALALRAARAEVDRLVTAGSGRGEAARQVAATTGLPRRRLYGGSDAA